MAKQYFIYENGGPMDGEFYTTRADLIEAWRYADDGDRAIEWDDVTLVGADITDAVFAEHAELNKTWSDPNAEHRTYVRGIGI